MSDETSETQMAYVLPRASRPESLIGETDPEFERLLDEEALIEAEQQLAEERELLSQAEENYTKASAVMNDARIAVRNAQSAIELVLRLRTRIRAIEAKASRVVEEIRQKLGVSQEVS